MYLPYGFKSNTDAKVMKNVKIEKCKYFWGSDWSLKFAVFFCSFAQLRWFRAFRPLPYRYLCGGRWKKVAFWWKKPVKYFVSSRNCRTFALAFGKFSGAGLRKGVFRGPLEEVIFDILQTTTRQQSAFPWKGSGLTAKQDTSIHLQTEYNGFR